mmetsp:Transcript_10785/g.22068  ORF Transcript_10785/g.22068 Transcript_10785/m.22068 type:complete len:134 (+) Transcript_10785:993-1394(+)
MSRFNFEMKSCPVAREIVKPFRDQVVPIVTPYMEDPRGKFADALVPRPVTNSQGIYTVVPKTDGIVQVHDTGSSKNMKTRKEYRVAKGLPPEAFVPVYDADNNIMEHNDRINALYNDCKAAILANTDLHPLQR